MRALPIAVLAVAFAGMGVALIWFAAPLPGLLPANLSPPLARLFGLVFLCAGLALLHAPARTISGLLLTVVWLGLAAIGTTRLSAPNNLSSWVPIAEMFSFAAAAAALAFNKSALGSARRIAFGGSLVLFGVVHLLHRDAIATLIPGWIPAAQSWPWVTGFINAGAGLALLAGFRVRAASLLIAVMFASWIAVVHCPRLIAAPASLFEWSFALNALALTAIAMLVAQGAPPARKRTRAMPPPAC